MNGIVEDSLEIPLIGANLIAIPASDVLDMKFSITDERGRYRLNLVKDSSGILEVSYLGFQKLTDTISHSQDLTHKFQMEPNNESLDEVLIKYHMDVVVKKDTIVYRTDVFKTVEEQNFVRYL